MSLKSAVQEFFKYLDIEEESDSGTVFHPVIVSSCRAILHEGLDQVLLKMRELSK